VLPGDETGAREIETRVGDALGRPDAPDRVRIEIDVEQRGSAVAVAGVQNNLIGTSVAIFCPCVIVKTSATCAGAESSNRFDVVHVEHYSFVVAPRIEFLRSHTAFASTVL
jgi:hypothetical protein